MDRNTITGIILIFLIFIGFSMFNSSRMNKAFERTVVLADSLYKKGELEKARTEYMNSLRLKPNNPDIMLKLNDINLKLGIIPPGLIADSTSSKTVAKDTVSKKACGQYI